MDHALNHPNLVVVTFDRYAGGSFFINCVSHNPGVLPGLSIVPEHDLDVWIMNPRLPDITKQEKKIERINSTLPAKIKMSDWASYELNFDYFWNATGEELINGQEPNPDAVALLQNNFCFLVNYDTSIETHNKIKQQWPLCKHVALTNVKDFQKFAALKKGSTEIPQASELPNDLDDVFYVDVDRVYSRPERMRQRAIECVEWFGVPSNLHPNLKDYSENYFQLHC